MWTGMLSFLLQRTATLVVPHLPSRYLLEAPKPPSDDPNLTTLYQQILGWQKASHEQAFDDAASWEEKNLSTSYFTGCTFHAATIATTLSNLSDGDTPFWKPGYLYFFQRAVQTIALTELDAKNRLALERFCLCSQQTYGPYTKMAFLTNSPYAQSRTLEVCDLMVAISMPLEKVKSPSDLSQPLEALQKSAETLHKIFATIIEEAIATTDVTKMLSIQNSVVNTLPDFDFEKLRQKATLFLHALPQDQFSEITPFVAIAMNDWTSSYCAIYGLSAQEARATIVKNILQPSLPNDLPCYTFIEEARALREQYEDYFSYEHRIRLEAFSGFNEYSLRIEWPLDEQASTEVLGKGTAKFCQSSAIQIHIPK